MPIEVVTSEAGQNRSYTIWNDARVEHHLIEVGNEVDSVALDPEDWILARIKVAGAFSDGPPKVIAIDPPPRSVHFKDQPVTLDVTFHRDVVVDEGDVVLRRVGGGEHEIGVSYDPVTQTARLTTDSGLPGGWYQVVVSDQIVDAEDGIALDGELDPVRSSLPSGDGVAGGEAVIEFGVIGVRPSPVRRLAPGPRTKSP
jgi:hypothetical protein